jgi:hypothetical protein
MRFSASKVERGGIYSAGIIVIIRSGEAGIQRFASETGEVIR